ncbi:MAG: metal-dependent hydrolase [Actinomycetia bacterium]|nr:metal-dependent hydrolase [Actinomycetes bacterium]
MKLDGVEITWLGHAAFRFRLDDGTTFVVDPFLTNNPLCPAEEKQPEQVDVIFVTHGHRDHLGDTASVARSTGASVFSIFEIKRWLVQQGVEDDRTVPLNKGGTVSAAAGVKATFVHAVHSSGIYGEEGMINGGAAGGWVIDFPGGPTVYHAGDTDLFGDMRLIGELWEPDIACLPIGGHFTMAPRSAAKAARLLGVETVIPMHFGTFPVLAGRPDHLREHSGGAFQVRELTVGAPVR